MKKRLALISVVALTLLNFALPAQAKVAKQSFVIMLNSEEGGPMIAAGPITASGWDAEGPDGMTSVFTFKRGSLNIHHKTTPGTDNFSMNDVTCVGKFTEKGTYRSTSGTGSYAGTSVSGTYSVKGMVTFPHTGDSCGEVPVGFTTVIKASGPISWR